MKKVVIIIVNWKGCGDTVDCLESIKKVSYPDCRVIVVDNGSGDGSEKTLKEKYPEHTIMQSGSNLGFAGGVNIGIRHALGSGADLVLVLNNDTEVTPGFLTELVNAMERDENIGITGGRIFYSDKRDKLWSYGGYFDVNTGRAHHFTDVEGPGKELGSSEFIYAQGCMMLIKKECLEKTGLFDERFFHLGEDVEYCVRAQKKGWKIAMEPQSKIYHRVSSSMTGLSPVYNYYEQRNRLFIVKKYHSYGNILVLFRSFLVIVLRILHRIFFGSRRGSFFFNARCVFLAVSDFLSGRDGKRF